MKLQNTGETIAFPALNSHVETLAKYAAITGADSDLILTAIILEEIKNLNTERPYDASYALREFTLPDGEMEAKIHPCVLEDLKEYAQGFGVEAARVLTWCAMRGLMDLKAEMKQFEVDKNAGCWSKVGNYLSEIAELAVRLGVALNNRRPSYSIRKGEKRADYCLGDPACLLNFEIQFLHEEGFTPPAKRMSVLTFESEEDEEIAV